MPWFWDRPFSSRRLCRVRSSRVSAVCVPGARGHRSAIRRHARHLLQLHRFVHHPFRREPWPQYVTPRKMPATHCRSRQEQRRCGEQRVLQARRQAPREQRAARGRARRGTRPHRRRRPAVRRRGRRADPRASARRVRHRVRGRRADLASAAQPLRPARWKRSLRTRRRAAPVQVNPWTTRSRCIKATIDESLRLAGAAWALLRAELRLARSSAFVLIWLGFALVFLGVGAWLATSAAIAAGIYELTGNVFYGVGSVALANIIGALVVVYLMRGCWRDLGLPRTRRAHRRVPGARAVILLARRREADAAFVEAARARARLARGDARCARLEQAPSRRRHRRRRIRGGPDDFAAADRTVAAARIGVGGHGVADARRAVPAPAHGDASPVSRRARGFDGAVTPDEPTIETGAPAAVVPSVRASRP